MTSLQVRKLASQRILLKLSGEAFGNRGIEQKALDQIADQITRIHSRGVEVAVVVGGGNIFRGAERQGRRLKLDRVVADQMGMLATIINSLALQDALERRGVEAILQSAVAVSFVEPLDPRQAKWALDNGKVVIFAGGTGNPFVTTDTAAALRASEIKAQLLLKATNVDGVHTSDPKKDKSAKRLKRVSYEEVIQKKLEVMDIAAVDICRGNRIPIVVFDLFKPGNLERALAGEEVGTLVH